MKAVVDQDLCISCGLCETLCGDVFSLDEYDLAVAIDSEIPAKFEADCKRATKQCPVNAITLD